MKKTALSFLIAFMVFAISCQAQKPTSKDISLTWGLVGNYYEGELLLSQLEIQNNSHVALDNKGWSLYFNFCRKFIETKQPKGFTVSHVNGDLFVIKPTEEFKPIKNGERIKLDLYSGYWVLNESDAPAGFYFVFDDGAVENITKVNIHPFVTEKQLKRTANDNVAIENPQVRFDRAVNMSVLPKAKVCPITPTPNFYKLGPDSFIVDSKITIAYEAEFKTAAEYLQTSLTKPFGLKPQTSVSIKNNVPQIRFVKDANLKVEAYSLVVNKTNGVTIKASSAIGAFYGMQSLLALCPSDIQAGKKKTWKITDIEVQDAPRFEYRGLHVDCARNFQKKETLLKLIDIMSFYKMNRLHLHLTDDEGWRIEIPELPELTSIGSKRGYSKTGDNMGMSSFGSGPETNFPGSGYYTKADFIEILKFAKERNVTVIPEVDFPGHSRAAIISMKARYNRLMKEGKPEEASKYLLSEAADTSKYESVQMWKDNVICPCQESTFSFVDVVFSSIMNTYKEAGLTLTTIHIGGDEVPHGVWEKSPKCNEMLAKNPQYNKVGGISDYFLTRLSDIINSKGLITAGWEEIALMKVKEGDAIHHQPNPLFIAKNFQPYVWNNVWGWGQEDYAYQLANAGYKTVLANVTNLYFDLAYYKDPLEPGYYWGGFTDTKEVFEFTPFNIFASAETDLLGNPLDLASINSKVRITEEGKKNVLGIQCHLWSENTKSQEIAEYLLFPRMIAFAERAWAADPTWSNEAKSAGRTALVNTSWNEFANRLASRELPRLDYAFGKVAYRIPLAGITQDGSEIKANVSYPGLTIRYTTDGSEPTSKSSVYNTPFKAKKGQVVKMKVFSTTGRASRVSEITVK